MLKFVSNMTVCHRAVECELHFPAIIKSKFHVKKKKWCLGTSDSVILKIFKKFIHIYTPKAPQIYTPKYI